MMTRRFVSLVALVPAVLATLGLLSMPSFASKRAPASKPKIFAQRLVEEVASKHPEVAAVELAVRSSAGCSTIAASDSKDIGEKCDEDELGAMRTGEPVIEKENDGFDLTMPLHDTAGRTIGTLGLDIKPEPGQQKSSVVERAKKIVQEVEAQIPSKAKLLEPVE